jgi:hypothetical protein
VNFVEDFMNEQKRSIFYFNLRQYKQHMLRHIILSLPNAVVATAVVVVVVAVAVVVNFSTSEINIQACRVQGIGNLTLVNCP